jgi:broad specificity phosphatase PhoE
MRILLIRHGQDDREYRGGWSQRALIPEGVAQAEALGRALQAAWQPITRLISSDLPRAAQTAEIVGAALALPVEHNSAWREINNGLLAGMYNPDAERRYPGLYFAALGMDEHYPHGESPRQHFARTQGVFGRLCAQINLAPAEHVAVVTHGGCINIVYHLVRGLEWSNGGHSFPCGPTSIHELQLVDGAWQVTRENSREHLELG